MQLELENFKKRTYDSDWSHQADIIYFPEMEEWMDDKNDIGRIKFPSPKLINSLGKV